MSFDVFISYSSKDKTVADAACARLESAGIRCWIAPRDVIPGMSYGEAIIDAIHAAKVMVLVFSSNANASAHIPKEIERAVSNSVTIVPFRIEDVAPGKSLDYFIGSVHWLDAMTPPLEKHLDHLVATIQKLLSTTTSTPQHVARLPQEPVLSGTHGRIAPKPSQRPPARKTWLALAAAALLAAIIGVVALLHKGDASHPFLNLPPSAPAPSLPASYQIPSSSPTTTDSIVGCYQWFNNQPVVIHADGTLTGGPFTAHWRLMSAARREYAITWPEATDTVTLSADQQSLSGGNQYGFPASGTRISGRSGLVGVWRWPNGVPVVVAPNGIFTAATFHGRWDTEDATRGVYTLTWPNPVDSLTLSADGSRLSGANQYGVTISGVKTEPCLAN